MTRATRPAYRASMAIILFEDDVVPQLYPITIGRPAMLISCGSYRLVDLMAMIDESLFLCTRPHLQAVLAADGWNVNLQATPPRQKVLFVNARLVPSVAVLERVREIWNRGEPLIARQGATTVLALVKTDHPLPAVPAGPQDWNFFLEACQLPSWNVDLPLFEYPHDVVRHNLTAFADNIQLRIKRGSYQEIADGVFAASGAKLGQYVITDTTAGPVVLDENATIGPYTLLRGPIYIGPQGRVLEHAAIKDCVTLGHTTKIGGEVEGSVVEPYTNKQHHGFLGHSYLGSWVNLGAGTCNSDLKNTYGQVNMEYHGKKVATGMQFVGCMVGDYAKTAINTGIFTGKTIGACSMVYGFVTTNVPSFTNYARLFGQVTETPAEVLVATQARMFARRKVQQRPCDTQLLYDMYNLTSHERQMAGEPLAL
ncbi:MAG: hypothetical protein JNM18_26570 [Planctomycetaceae bacterium]|nr:hypothetical protein [Planctomycetaceae bacterium]